MRKAVMIVLALLAIRLLPKALRREARALELITLLFQVTIATATSKSMATEQRTAALELATRAAAAAIAAQRGHTTAFSNLAQTETGSPQVGGPVYDVSSAVSGGALIQTGSPNVIGGGTVTNHSHGYGHIHDASHFHFNQMDGDFNNLVAQLNTMRTALVNANLL